MFRFLSIISLFLISVLLPAQSISVTVKPSSNEGSTITDTIINQTTGPEIFFSKTSHDLKTVLQGSELSYKFEFRNTGNEPLLISNIRSSCQCTVASFPKTPIPAGEIEYITLNLDTKKLGLFNKRVGVYSNAINDIDESINKSRILLNIKWEVVEEVSISKDVDE